MDAYDPAQPLSRTRRQQLWVRLAIRGAIFVGLLLLVFVFGPPLLGYVMPFLLAFLFTWLMEPLLRFFQRRLRMPRKAGAIVLILILVAALGGIITAIVLRLWGEISSLINNWDQVWNTFQSTYQQLAQDMQRWLSYLPQGVQDVILSLSDRLLAWLRDMAYNLVPGTTSAVRGLSSFVLAFVFFLLAWFFTAADYPNLRRHLHEKTPKSIRHVGRQAKTAFAAAFGGYVKAEVLVSLGVMVILMVGFLLLKQPYGILLAVLLALVGGIVYTVLTWPIYPQPQKNVDSYAQLREDLAQTELLAPPEDILPWHDVTYGEELDGRSRTSKARGFLISGHVSRGDASCFVELVGLEDHSSVSGEIPLLENYRTVPICRSTGEQAMLYIFNIRGNEYSARVYLPEDASQDVTDYFDGLLQAACREIIDLYS